MCYLITLEFGLNIEIILILRTGEIKLWKLFTLRRRVFVAFSGAGTLRFAKTREVNLQMHVTCNFLLNSTSFNEQLSQV